MRSRWRGWLGVLGLGLAFAGACGQSRGATQATVTVDADDGIRADAESLVIRVYPRAGDDRATGVQWSLFPASSDRGGVHADKTRGDQVVAGFNLDCRQFPRGNPRLLQVGV